MQKGEKHNQESNIKDSQNDDDKSMGLKENTQPHVVDISGIPTLGSRGESIRSVKLSLATGQFWSQFVLREPILKHIEKEKSNRLTVLGQKLYLCFLYFKPTCVYQYQFWHQLCIQSFNSILYYQS